MRVELNLCNKLGNWICQNHYLIILLLFPPFSATKNKAWTYQKKIKKNLSGIVAYNRNKKARCSNARYLKKGMCFLFLYWLLEVRIFKNIHLRRTLLLFIYLLCSYASVYCVISISIFGALSKIVLENYAPYPSIQVRYIWWYTHTWFMKWRHTSNMMRYKYKT
jgi:hypothetical protein